MSIDAGGEFDARNGCTSHGGHGKGGKLRLEKLKCGGVSCTLRGKMVCELCLRGKPVEWRQRRREWVGRSRVEEALVVESCKNGEVESSGGKLKLVPDTVASGGHVDGLLIIVHGGGRGRRSGAAGGARGERGRGGHG